MDPQYERRQLRKIERWFEVTDPQLAITLAGSGSNIRTFNRRSVRFIIYGLGVACIALGAVLVLPLAFVGVVLLMVGACLHITCRRGQTKMNN